jgi:hypothetical protein
MGGHDDPTTARPATPRTGRPRPGARDLVAAALAAGQTARDAAAAGGVHERTVWKWLGDSCFKARVDALRAGAVATALSRLSSAMTTAADVLRDLLGSRDEHVRFKAARAVVELGVRLDEHAELKQRIEELERKLGGAP